MNSNLVSVCIPLYNHEDYIEETIISLINQSYQNIELFIINDGSPDNSHAKVLKLKKTCENRFTNFQYISRENKGQMETLKELEKLITGEYLIFLDSDDYFHPEKITKQVSSLQKNLDCALCYTKVSIVNKNSEIIKAYKSTHNKSGWVFPQLLRRNFIPNLSVMMRTSIFKSLGGYDLSHKIQDLPLWLKITEKYPIYYLAEELAYYRSHDNNISSNMPFMIKALEGVINVWSHKPCYQKTINYYYFRWFTELIKAKEFKLANHYMQKCAFKYHFHPKFIKSYLILKNNL